MVSKRVALRLYKDILRQHCYVLSPKHRELGDRYVRSEFRAHKDASGQQVEQFLQGWQGYLEQLQHQKGPAGQSLSEEEAANLSDEQRQQLLRLKQQTMSSAGTAIGELKK